MIALALLARLVLGAAFPMSALTKLSAPAPLRLERQAVPHSPRPLSIAFA